MLSTWISCVQVEKSGQIGNGRRFFTQVWSVVPQRSTPVEIPTQRLPFRRRASKSAVLYSLACVKLFEGPLRQVSARWLSQPSETHGDLLMPCRSVRRSPRTPRFSRESLLSTLVALCDSCHMDSKRASLPLKRLTRAAAASRPPSIRGAGHSSTLVPEEAGDRALPPFPSLASPEYGPPTTRLYGL